jgi:hypothetical protein
VAVVIVTVPELELYAPMALTPLPPVAVVIVTVPELELYAPMAVALALTAPTQFTVPVELLFTTNAEALEPAFMLSAVMVKTLDVDPVT